MALTKTQINYLADKLSRTVRGQGSCFQEIT